MGKVPWLYGIFLFSSLCHFSLFLFLSTPADFLNSVVRCAKVFFQPLARESKSQKPPPPGMVSVFVGQKWAVNSFELLIGWSSFCHWFLLALIMWIHCDVSLRAPYRMAMICCEVPFSLAFSLHKSLSILHSAELAFYPPPPIKQMKLSGSSWKFALIFLSGIIIVSFLKLSFPNWAGMC